MRRSLLEFERAMPGMLIVAAPVFAGRGDTEAGAGWPEIAMLTLSEYDKYLATLLRPGIPGMWSHGGEPHTVAAVDSAAAASVSRRP